MSSDNGNNNPGPPPPAGDASRPRRGSVTSAAFTNLFQRSNSSSAGSGTQVFPGPVTTAAMNDQRRRLSITTLGLSGTSPTQQQGPFGARRSSMSTNNSDSIDENAVDEDEFSARTAPTTPFTRRMSFGAQAMRNMRPGAGPSPGASNGRPSPPLPRRASLARTPPSSVPIVGPGTGTSALAWSRAFSSQASNASRPRSPSDLTPSPPARTADQQQGFNWSEQLRSRAESAVTGSRPSFSFASGLQSGSPPRGLAAGGSGQATAAHDRAKSVSDMPAPPAQAPKPRSQKPDHFQERILKGDFYMD